MTSHLTPPSQVPPTFALAVAAHHLREGLVAAQAAYDALNAAPSLDDARMPSITALEHTHRAVDAAQAVLAEWIIRTTQ